MARRRRLWRDETSNGAAALSRQVADLALPLATPADLDPLLDRIGEARYVLLGEASHGTAEYYTWRAAISKRLIEEKGFSFIAVEGDWPDCYRINRFVRALPDAGESARDVLHNFERWPTWMWANHEVLELTKWLREHNERVPEEQQVGFYGLDVYSLWDSLYQVMSYLRRSHPELLSAAQEAFHCFEPYGENVHDYARATRWLRESCEEEVIGLLAEVRRAAGPIQTGDHEADFDAQQNAWVVRNAEHYYRAMVMADAESWNIRDRHMTQTLERLMARGGPAAKAIVWEHNTHIGDARYTDMALEEMVNVGQLVREGHTLEDVVLVGFGSYRGSVIAAQAWEAPVERMTVPEGRPKSWEDVLHDAERGDLLLVFSEADRAGPVAAVRGHRAIGVVYHPESEAGNYVPTVLPRRYDAFLFIDESTALHPLYEVRPLDVGEVPETYPSGV